jgi:hypothetical protein
MLSGLSSRLAKSQSVCLVLLGVLNGSLFAGVPTLRMIVQCPKKSWKKSPSHLVNGGAPSVSASPKKNESGGSGTLIGAGLLCSQ